MSDALDQDPGEDRDASDEVGYKRPPRHSRFRKGRSGNPNGRAKGWRSFASLLGAALDGRVTVNENGKRSKISKREAIIRQLVNRSASADLKAIAMVVALMQQAEGAAATPAKIEDLDEADLKVLRQLGERAARARGGDSA
jgi:hypothetical protein